MHAGNLKAVVIAIAILLDSTADQIEKVSHTIAVVLHSTADKIAS